MNSTRRTFLKTAVAGLPFSASMARARGIDRSKINGVQLGVQTYSFHEIPNDGRNHSAAIIKDMLACGLYACELFSCQIEPGTYTGQLPPASDCPAPLKGCSSEAGGSQRNPWAWEFRQFEGEKLVQARERQKKWRETVSLGYFREIRKQFNDAGVQIVSYNVLGYGPDNSDLEIDRTFQMAKTLGAKAINVSTTLTILKRLVPFAEKNQVMIAPHGHSVTWDPEEFSTRESFVKALTLSKWVGANLDIGHYAAVGQDPIKFIESFHDRIPNLHLKDRRKNRSATAEDGANVPWGQGDTPIKEVLLLLKNKKYPIPAFIEYEHMGTEEPVAEVKKCFQYCKQILEG